VLRLSTCRSAGDGNFSRSCCGAAAQRCLGWGHGTLTRLRASLPCSKQCALPCGVVCKVLTASYMPGRVPCSAAGRTSSDKGTDLPALQLATRSQCGVKRPPLGLCGACEACSYTDAAHALHTESERHPPRRAPSVLEQQDATLTQGAQG
jgi:hypothetical protein